MGPANARRNAARTTALAGLFAILLGSCSGTVGPRSNQSGSGSTTGGPGSSGSTGGPGTGSVTGTAGTTGTGSATGAGGATPTMTTPAAFGSCPQGGATPTMTTPAAFGSCPQGGGEPGVSPLSKLSTFQYRNTVRDLLTASGLSAVATEVAPVLASVPDDGTVVFRGLDKRITANHIQAYFDVAVAVANAATSTSARLTSLAGSCATTSPLSASCLDAFLNGFARRAYRRPLDAEELAELRDVGRGTNPAPADSAEAIRNVVVTMLMSPRFVNHLELAGSPISGRENYLALDPYEIASRLSYTFWQTLPDDALLAAAADGSLTTDAGFSTQLGRVFADARTKDTIWQFWNEWMRFESFTGFSAERPAFQALAAGQQVGAAGHDHWGDMVREVRELTELYTWTRQGTFTELMTSDLSVTRSADLARLYGVTAWSGSGEYPRFTDGSRVGVLQRAALLASSLEQTNPFHRGSLIRRSILCDVLPQPSPNDLPPGSLDPPPPSNALTTRQRFEMKVAGNGLCETCHGSFSDIGYALEAYDALGRFRTTEKVFDEQTGAVLATLPVNTAAMPRIAGGDDRVVSGPAELNQRILESGKVEACLSANYFRYAMRRNPTRDSADACAYEAMRTDLDKPGVGLADVFRRIAVEAGFRRRTVGAP